MKYSVKKNPNAVLSPWQVHNPEGKIVWRAQVQWAAFSIAHMFARRRELQARIQAEGLRITTMP